MSTTENQAIIEALREAGEVEIRTVAFDGDEAVVAVTGGGRVLDIKSILDPWRSAPEDRRGTSKHLTLPSLIAYVKREALATECAIFASWSPPQIEAVLDHNEPDHLAPAWRRYRALYQFPVTPEWQAWVDATKKELSQRDFAAFLEERAGDIVEASQTGALAYAARHALEYADAARVRSLARGLRVNVSREIANEENLETGEANIVFREQHAGSGNVPLRIPRAFVVLARPFEGGPSYEVPVRLRYRIEGAAVIWGLTVPGVDRFIRDAITEAASTVAAETGCALFFGSDAGAR